jgi:hypothetical protein
MSKRVLNPDQLAMFIPAHQLMDTTALDTEEEKGPKTLRNATFGRQSVPERKIQEAKDEGLFEEIEKEGVKTPVTLGTHPFRKGPMTYDYFPGYDYKGTVIMDGHHRISVANSIDPNMEIPVQYHHPNDDLG